VSTAQSPAEIAELIRNYITEHPAAAVIEDGKILFDFTSARYSAAPERDRCLLQLWSEEANIVRRVVAAELRQGTLKLSVQRFGQSKPSRMEICAQAERRSPSALKAMRAAYQRTLERALPRAFPGWTIARLTTAADLEHSFSAVYCRGLLRRGPQQIAVVGCGEGESQATIDNAAAVAVLWLDHCRRHLDARAHTAAVALFVPEGRALTARLRLSHLDREAAAWRLFALDDATEFCEELDLAEELNLSSQLVHSFSAEQTLERFADSIARLRALMPAGDFPLECVPVSASAVGFRFHGLEFARASLEPDRHFRLSQRIVFGAPPAEYELNAETEPLLVELMERLVRKRVGRERKDPFYRLQPERWLQSVVERDLSLVDPRLEPALFYRQVPAFAASDRAVIDLLGLTREGRLAVIELKAAEDFHLPMQGLDYWARVRQLHRSGELQRHGYFPDRILSEHDPILILAAPALHLHPSTETMLRYVSPGLDWTMAALDERWRDGIRVVFRKQRAAADAASSQPAS
jgi:hypothetical protein